MRKAELNSSLVHFLGYFHYHIHFRLKHSVTKLKLGALENFFMYVQGKTMGKVNAG